jgi:RNA-binding protein YlmH
MGQKDFLTSKIKEAAESAINYGNTVYVDFCEPAVQMLIEREIARYPGAECAFFGGHEYCGRKMICIFPQDRIPIDEDFPLCCIQIPNAPQELTHQDVLGALMGLNIERDKTGDIDIKNNIIQFFISGPLGEFVSQNLTKINKYDVKAELVSNDKIITFEPVFTPADIIIPSMRLDAVIHTVYKMSRNEAAAFIKAQKVKINHQIALKPSAGLKEGDVVSVRTKGRFIVDEIGGTTKKGNLKLKVRKFT